jgi:hypothetical protein
VPGELEIGIARGIPLTVTASAVELGAVDLDGEAVGRPVRVDLGGGGRSLNYRI